MNYTVNVLQGLFTSYYEVVCAKHLPETVALYLADRRYYRLIVNNVTIAAPGNTGSDDITVTVIGSPDGHHLHGVLCQVCEGHVANGYDIDGKVVLD